MNIVQVGIGDKKITEILSKLGVLSAVCDIELKNKELGERFSVKYYDSLDNLMKFEDFQGALVNVENSESIPVVKKLLQAKKHVFVNNPIHDVPELFELEEMSNKKKIKLVFGFEKRFNPVIKTLRNTIVDQKYGELVMLEIYHESVTLDGKGIIIDEVIHAIDSANWIYGELPVMVFARMGNWNSEKENFSSIVIGYKNNKTAVIISNGLSSQNTSTLRANCSRGVIFSDLISHEIKINGISENIPKNDSMLQQIQNFIDLIQENNEIEVKSHELSNTIKIAEAAFLSSKQGAPIYLDLK